MSHSFHSFPLFTVFLQFTEVDDILHHLGQVVAPSSPQVLDTSDTSANESRASHPRGRVPSKCTYKIKKLWEAAEVGQFFVIGGTDAVGKPSHLHCRIWRKDV